MRRHIGSAKSFAVPFVSCPGIFGIILVIFVSLVQSAMAADSDGASATMLSTNSPFVLYLVNPPWVKIIRYADKEIVEMNGNKVWRTRTNLTAWQPSGFYVKMLAPPLSFPGQAESNGLGGVVVFGKDSDYLWSANPRRSVLALCPVREVDGASPSNGMLKGVDVMLEHNMHEVRFFGFPELETNSFKLLGANHFQAETSEGRTIHGDILEATNDRPIRLEYHFGSNGVETVQIKYEYNSPDTSLPSAFECARMRSGKPYLNRMHWILDAEYGLNKEVTNGYPPSQFFTNLASFSRLSLWSNGVRYSVKPDGHLVAVRDATMAEANRDRGPDPARGGFGVIVISLLVGGFFVFLAVRRAGRSQKQPT